MVLFLLGQAVCWGYCCNVAGLVFVQRAKIGYYLFFVIKALDIKIPWGQSFRQGILWILLDQLIFYCLFNHCLLFL